jgi:hypothetical protein
MHEIAGLARLVLRLWRQAWPVLLLLATLGSIANKLLLPLAVKLGYLNSLAGLPCSRCWFSPSSSSPC